MGWEYKIYFSNDFISLKKWDNVNNNLVDTQKRQTHEVSMWLNDVGEIVPSHYLMWTLIPTGTASVGFVVSGRVHKVGYLLSHELALDHEAQSESDVLSWKGWCHSCVLSAALRGEPLLWVSTILMSLELWFGDGPKSPLKQLTFTTSLVQVVYQSGQWLDIQWDYIIHP